MQKENSKKFQNYYLGLDLGTDSVGWAVTDLNYKLLRVNNKSLWGVRLFEEAKTAKDRRSFRTARRRLQRRKQRLQLLQEIFAPIINEIDSNFFARLADSNLYDGDKREKTWFSLFADKDFNDRDFHRKYKTVYHLRKAMTEEEDPDPRLVYLALHHLIKNRGHFLVDGDMDAVNDILQPLKSINAYLEERDCGQLSPTCTDEFRHLLETLKCGKNDRAKAFAQCFGVADNKKLVALLKLISGSKVKLGDLPIDIDSEEGKQSISFDENWEAEEQNVRTILGDDFILIQNVKLLYDYAQLKALLGEHNTLSEAMVAKYEKHQKDLALLKKILRKYFERHVYDNMFKTPPKGKFNYTTYCGKTKFGKHILEIEKKCTNYEDFAKYVKEVLLSNEQAKQDADVNSIIAELDNGTFLPKQVSKNNSTIPYQLNEQELRAILQHVRRYDRFAFLNQCDEDGIDNAEKIRQILVFRVPYFVGPTNNHSGKYWIVRKESGRILPWNYQKKIDLDASEVKFVENLTSFCPYLPDEKVLPKCSLLYEEFVFLNIVSKIKINNELLTVEQKSDLSDFFAQTGTNKLTTKILKSWLENNYHVKTDNVVFEGFDEGASASRRTYYQFAKILGGKQEVEKHRDEIEQIIFDITVGANEKNRLLKHLKSCYGFLSEQQLKSIAGLTCVGWGKCSKKFLTLRVGVNPFTGEAESFSVMDAMRETTDNFNQVYQKYGFKDYFERRDETVQFNYSSVDALYCSPAVKKQIWQALCVVKELRSVLGTDPKKIFVEVAREKNPQKERDAERNRTKSRLKELKEKFANEVRVPNQTEEDVKTVKSALEQMEESPRKLNETKLFLYFLQNGVDIYTGEPIDYNNLNLYDKDHIYPRSKVKDDSLDNLVLTWRTHNAEKSNDYPIDGAIQQKMEPVWKALRNQHLMSEEKFRRLTRKTPLSNDEIMDFVNRQLVETRQSTKETIKLLKALFPNTEVVYSKASLVSEFRARQSNETFVDPITGEIENVRRVNFVKCREINDLHHAKDAYLNIVVGNVYNTRYGHNRQFLQDGVDRGPSDANIYDYTVATKDYIAWTPGNDGTISRVKKTMRSNTPLYTAESFVESELLEKTSIFPKNSGDNLIPLKGSENSDERLRKMSNPAKYGGYNSERRAYFMLVKYIEEKRTKTAVKQQTRYSIVGVMARFANKLIDDATRKEYCLRLGLNDPQILVEKIKIGTFFRFGETILALSSVQSNGKAIVWRLAQQNRQSDETERYFKKVCAVVEKRKERQKSGLEFVLDERDGIDSRSNMRLYDTFVETLLSSRYSGAKSLISFAEKLRDKCRQEFVKLNLLEQCTVLLEVGKALQCNAVLSNLELLKEGARSGKISTSNTFDSLEGISIIHRSVTGIFEQQINLQDLADKAVTV